MNVTSDTPLTSLASIRPIQGWEEFQEDGDSYLRTAESAFEKRRDIFTSSILYNLVAMAVEKFVMAALMRHGTMPYNHTMVDLVEAMEKTFPGAIAAIKSDLLRLDTYQDICDPYDFTIGEPDMDEIPGMLNLAQTLRQLVKNELTAGI